MQRDFEELPAGAAESLRSSLVELLLRYGNAGIVRTQLCLAIAALVAHLPSEGWGPGGSVQWLVQRLGMEPGPSALPCLLDLLTILPQVGQSIGGKQISIVDDAGHCLLPSFDSAAMQPEIKL